MDQSIIIWFSFTGTHLGEGSNWCKVVFAFERLFHLDKRSAMTLALPGIWLTFKLTLIVAI